MGVCAPWLYLSVLHASSILAKMKLLITRLLLLQVVLTCSRMVLYAVVPVNTLFRPGPAATRSHPDTALRTDLSVSFNIIVTNISQIEYFFLRC